MPQKCFPERQKGLKPHSIKTVGKVTGSLSQVTTELMNDQNRGQIYQHKLGFGIKKKENHCWYLQRKHGHKIVWKICLPDPVAHVFLGVSSQSC